jgi:hypothetical protein
MKFPNLLLALAVSLTVTTCDTMRDEIHAAAADHFTERYSRSRLSAWNVRADAAGRDCAVLFIEASLILEDAMVEAMHYGAGAYDIYDGGVQQFCRDRAFRGAAYKDSTGKIWTFGAVTEAEAESLKRCRS